MRLDVVGGDAIVRIRIFLDEALRDVVIEQIGFIGKVQRFGTFGGAEETVQAARAGAAVGHPEQDPLAADGGELLQGSLLGRKEDVAARVEPFIDLRGGVGTLVGKGIDQSRVVGLGKAGVSGRVAGGGELSGFDRAGNRRASGERPRGSGGRAAAIEGRGWKDGAGRRLVIEEGEDDAVGPLRPRRIDRRRFRPL